MARNKSREKGSLKKKKGKKTAPPLNMSDAVQAVSEFLQSSASKN